MKNLYSLACGGIGLAVLFGCADPVSHWHKPGVADAERERDYRDCRELVRTSTQSGVDQDIAVSRASGIHSPGGADEAPGGADEFTARAASQAMISCMTDRGYRGE